MYKPYFVKHKEVGRLHDDHTYVTHRWPKRHYFIKGQGYAISSVILLDLEVQQATDIIIIEHRADGSERHYVESLRTWLTAPYFSEPDADGQRCIPLIHMNHTS